MMNRRDLMAAALTVPLTASLPQHTQRLPLISLPQPSPPTGLGVGAPWQSGDNIPAMLERLQPAWWYDWRFEQCGARGYVPMIWSASIWRENAAVLTSLFERRPDTFWLLWNEPERSDQANMQPDEAATLTATIAAHGIEYAAPGVSLNGDGYLWLEDYLRHGGPIPHCWHVHIYNCMTPAQWAAAWLAWVHWMQERNVVRPTIVSETNAWTEGDFGQRALLEYLAEAVSDVDLLQAVAWFATRWDAWATGHPHLMGDSGDLTTVGDTFAQLRQQS